MANVRISRVEQRPDGQFEVSAVLPNGALVEMVTEAVHDRNALARLVVASEHRRALPHLTGFAEIPDEEYEALLAQGQAKTRAILEARSNPPTYVADDVAVEEESESQGEQSAEGAETAEGTEGEQKSRRARR